MNTLTINNVSVSFRDHQVLKQVGLDFENGIYGLIGPNGAGKSTLIRVITGLLSPDEGQILWNWKNLDQKTLCSVLGFMPQHQNGYDVYTAREFLLYMSALKNIPQAAAKERIEKLARMTGLSRCLDQKIRTYSGGMKQRLFFIQALLNNPRLLILDEPTAGLDPYERIRIRNLISRLSRDRVILIATHVMQDIESIADEIILLRDGEIVCSGPIPDLLKTLEGKVQELEIPVSQLKEISRRARISKTTRCEKGYRLRVISEQRFPEASEVLPELEDCYLYYLS